MCKACHETIMKTADIKTIREQFPALSVKIEGRELIYFDNACSILKPKCVIKSVNNFIRNYGGCAGGRSSHIMSNAVENMCSESRKKTAVFLGAEQASEIIFTLNTTHAINLVAKSFPYSEGKNEILLTGYEHHSCLLPFAQEAESGKIKLKIIPGALPWNIDVDSFCKNINEHTALVCMPMASNVTGQIFPYQKVIKTAHKYGACVLLDAAQYVAYNKVNVCEEDIDMLAFSGHKIGSLTAGVLYCKQEIMNTLHNYAVGGGTVSSVNIVDGKVNVDYLRGYRRFEAGLQDYTGIISLSSAIDYIKYCQKNDVSKYIYGLTKYLRSKLLQYPQIKMLGPLDGNSSIASFMFKNKNFFAQDFNIMLNTYLEEKAVCVRCGTFCAAPSLLLNGVNNSVRLSFFAYNTKEEIDVFLKILDKFLKQ